MSHCVYHELLGSWQVHSRLLSRFPWDLTAKISVVSILIWDFCLDKNTVLLGTHGLLKVGLFHLKQRFLSCNLPWLQWEPESTLSVHLWVTCLVLFQASEEEEIVDLMLMKLFSFFGIKCKKEEKPVTDEQQEQPVSKWMKTTLKSPFACGQSILILCYQLQWLELG